MIKRIGKKKKRRVRRLEEKSMGRSLIMIREAGGWNRKRKWRRKWLSFTNKQRDARTEGKNISCLWR
jgi:hypothetical protein